MKIPVIILFSLLATIGCGKKDDDPPNCGLSIAEIAGNYKITKMESVAGSQSTDLTDSYLDQCHKDDIYHLNSDKTLVFEDAGTACIPTSAKSGTWDIINDKLVFNINASGWFISDGRLLNECNKFIVYQSIGLSDLKITFVRQ